MFWRRKPANKRFLPSAFRPIVSVVEFRDTIPGKLRPAETVDNASHCNVSGDAVARAVGFYPGSPSQVRRRVSPAYNFSEEYARVSERSLHLSQNCADRDSRERLRGVNGANASVVSGAAANGEREVGRRATAGSAPTGI